MRFVCVDRRNGKHVYTFVDRADGEVCQSCKELADLASEGAGHCAKKRYYSRKIQHDGPHAYFFCLDNVSTRRQAQQLIKLTIDAYRQSSQIKADMASIADSTVELAVHNTRNLNAEINTKLLSLLNESKLMAAPDKVAFVESAMRSASGRFAREILSVLKSTSQIMHEYNIVDFLSKDIVLRDVDFGKHKAHTLYVMSFYLYEHEFKKKGITVQSENNWDEVRVHWATARTAVAQLLDNCMKYCKPNEPMGVRFRRRDAEGQRFLDIIFEMTSLYFSNSEAPRLLSPRVRGGQSHKLPVSGKGLGLGIIKRMMELNRGVFTYTSHEQTRFISDEVPYSQNEFILSFLRM